MRIGIVNDVMLATAALRRVVAATQGCTVAWTAANGAEAVEKAASDPVDMIMMDLIMPVMDGVEATRRIKATAGPNAETPVIALTANALEHHRAEWAAVGVHVFLSKPIEPQDLFQALLHAGRAAAERRRAA